MNNLHAVQFKQGAFALGALVCPVAIRYSREWSIDAYWNSREQSFACHLYKLMTSWFLVCDIWFLEPTRCREGESPTDFAERVKASICAKAQLKSVDFDGRLL